MMALTKSEIEDELKRLGLTEESEVDACTKEYEKFSVIAVVQAQRDQVAEH